MNRNHLTFGILLVAGVSPSDFSFAQGGIDEIQFRGVIVGESCAASNEGKGFALRGCAALARGNVISMDAVHSISLVELQAVHLKLVRETDEGQNTFSQQFTVVNPDNVPVKSGAYVVTITSP
jgi:hypothetical protein